MTQKKYNFIYKTTNLINGKIYVGRHSTNRLDDGYIGCGIYTQSQARTDSSFCKAVREFGYNLFQRSILEFSELNQLKEREKKWQLELHCTDPEIGYNGSITSTGGHKETYHHSDISLEKMSKFKQGFKHTQQSIEKIRSATLNSRIIVCPHCEKRGQSSIMKRWHFDNCKRKLIL